MTETDDMKKNGNKTVAAVMLIVAGLMLAGAVCVFLMDRDRGQKTETGTPAAPVFTSAAPEQTEKETVPSRAETVTETPGEAGSEEAVQTTEDPFPAAETSGTASEEETTKVPPTAPSADETTASGPETTEEETTEEETTEEATAAPTLPEPSETEPATEAPTTAAPTTEAPTTEAPTTEAPTTEAPTTEAPTTAAPATEAPTTAAPTTAAPTTAVPTTEAPTTAAPATEADMTAQEAAAYLAERFRQAFPGTPYLNKAQSLADSLAASKGSADLASAIQSAGLILNGQVGLQSAQIPVNGSRRDAVRSLADYMISSASAGSADGMAVGLYEEGGQLYAAVLAVSGELLTAAEAEQREEAARQQQAAQARALAESLNAAQMTAVNEILRLMNEERARVGVPALNLKTTYQPAASVRAREIVQKFDHTRPNGSACFTALSENGCSFSAAGENIAMFSGASDAASAGAKLYDLWFHSPGHYANMISGDFTDVTMEVYFEEKDGSVCAYGVQLFTAP